MKTRREELADLLNKFKEVRDATTEQYHLDMDRLNKQIANIKAALMKECDSETPAPAPCQRT